MMLILKSLIKRSMIVLLRINLQQRWLVIIYCITFHSLFRSQRFLMQKFNQRFTELSEGAYSDIIRNNVYQKGILKAWILVQRIGKRLKLKPIDTTKGFVILLDESLNNKLFVNDDKTFVLTRFCI